MNRIIKRTLLSLIAGIVGLYAIIPTYATKIIENQNSDEEVVKVYLAQDSEEQIYTNVDDKFNKINKIDFSQSFKLGEERYIIYYYMDRCGYCNLIKDELSEYALKCNYIGIYAVKMDDDKNSSGWYSMKEHHAEYDIEIGMIDSDGKEIYYDGESEEKYLDQENIDYKIVKTNLDNYEGYKKINRNALLDRIYAADYTPRIDYNNKDNFKIIGTPTAIFVEDGSIVDCAVGAISVLNLFEEYTEDLKQY